MVNRRWLFVCSCIALITSAFTFVVRGDVQQQMGSWFDLTQEQNGGIDGARFLGMAISMLVGGFVCDLLGMKRMLFVACASHLLGAIGMIMAPQSSASYEWLYYSSLLMGCGNGCTEVAINPLIATLYADRKTHYLNILHAWWPGGLALGGILARLIGLGIPFTAAEAERVKEGVGSATIPGLGLDWKVSLCLIVIPAVIYGIMLIPAKFPVTERVASGVSTSEMLKGCLRPLFFIWAFCMLLTAATELGPQSWQESVMTNTAGISGTMILVYTSMMMFVLRHFAGPIAHAISPTGMLTVSAGLAGIGLYLLSFAQGGGQAIAYATVFGLGIAYFWPTMLGVTAERFAKGGALALALMGSVGNLSISRVLPEMGKIVDSYAVQYVEQHDGTKLLADDLKRDKTTGQLIALDPARVAQLPKGSPAAIMAAAAQEEGYRMAFRWVSCLPVVLIVVFSGIILYDRSRGGYKPEILISREEENELMAGGVQGAVE